MLLGCRGLGRIAAAGAVRAARTIGTARRLRGHRCRGAAWTVRAALAVRTAGRSRCNNSRRRILGAARSLHRRCGDRAARPIRAALAVRAAIALHAARTAGDCRRRQAFPTQMGIADAGPNPDQPHEKGCGNGRIETHRFVPLEIRLAFTFDRGGDVQRSQTQCKTCSATLGGR